MERVVKNINGTFVKPVVQALLIAAYLGLCVTACSSGDCPEGTPSIDSFTADSTVTKPGGQLNLKFAVSNFAMTGHEGDGHDHEHDTDCVNSGHAHIHLDSVDGPLLAMALEVSVTVVIPANTTPGPHDVVIQLQDLQHKAISPVVQRKLAITVE